MTATTCTKSYFCTHRTSLIMMSMLTLTSCSTITPQAPTPKQQSLSWQARQQILSNLQTWKLNGKIAVQTDKDAGSASLDWQQKKAQYTISLMGPLGTNSMKLTGKPGQVTMETADGKHFSANTAEQLLSEQWGFNLPVSYLYYWVRGLPVPGLTHTDKMDNYQRLTSLSQQGFRVDYAAYVQTSKIDMPAKITISSPTLKTKIMIYDWQVL
jgi:outer membrane lipoprotein LolB